MRLALIAILFAATACGGSKPSTSTVENTDDSGSSDTGGQPYGGDEYGGETHGEGDVDPDCVEQCVAERQMEATSIENIQESCRGQCTLRE